MGALSDRKIKGATPRDSRYELADGDGLFVAIEPNGKKSFARVTNTRVNDVEPLLVPIPSSVYVRLVRAITR